ncbi:MAG: alpha/beta fold hydrolase [Anaerolineales bacterium]
MNKNINQEKIMKRRNAKVYFDNEDMDFNLMWVLGQASAGGAELGECIHVAARIKDGDTESWIAEWTEAGQRLEARAQAAEQAHHLVSARETYLRAFSYFHISTLFTRPQDKRLAENWRGGTACFQKAAALFNPPIVPIEVPFQPYPLHGYFMPALNGVAKAPTLIYVTGGEGWAETAYFWVGAGRSRGYNIVAVDLPYHVGSRLRYPELPLKTATEGIDAPLKAVIDYTVLRPDVDGDRVALIGFSFGGWCAMRAAMLDGDSRIKALIADSPIYNVYALSMAEFPPALLKAPAIVTNLVGQMAKHQNTTEGIDFERSLWQFNVGSLTQLLEMARGEVVKVDKIHCPTLCLASEGEAPSFLKQAHEVYDALNVPKKLHIFDAESGADSHCQVNNLTLMQEVVSDWLDETFGA